MVRRTEPPPAAKRGDPSSPRRAVASIPAVGSSRNRTSGPRERQCDREAPSLPPRQAHPVPVRQGASPSRSRTFVEHGREVRADELYVSRTRRSGGKPTSCSTAPMPRRAGGLRGSLPKSVARPASGRRSPRSSETAVDFPAPFGPSRARILPGGARDRPRRARHGTEALDARSRVAACGCWRHRVVTHRRRVAERLHRCYEAPRRRPVSETDRLAAGRREPRRARCSHRGRRSPNAGDRWRGRCRRRRSRSPGARRRPALAPRVACREEGGRDGQRSDAPERRDEQAEEQGSPDGLLVGRTGDEHDAAGDQSPAWGAASAAAGAPPSEDGKSPRAAIGIRGERLARRWIVGSEARAAAPGGGLRLRGRSRCRARASALTRPRTDWQEVQRRLVQAVRRRRASHATVVEPAHGCAAVRARRRRAGGSGGVARLQQRKAVRALAVLEP